MSAVATFPMIVQSNQSLLDSLVTSFAAPGPRGARVDALCSDCCSSNGNSCGDMPVPEDGPAPGEN